jgi:hypothetical protein
MRLIFAVLLMASVAYAKPKEKLSKDINFEDLLIQGKYHFSDEVVITVEQDKAINSLLHVRKNFKDRLKRSKFANQEK